MSNYVKTTNFLRKDSLPDTDNDKIIRGSEFDTEFNNLVTAVASKANTVSPELTGVPRAPTAATGTSSTQLATTAFVTQNAILRGMIVMWSGAIATIPAGYALCDGTSGTPDLRNRFIMGAGSTYTPGNTGGSANAEVISHTHSLSGSTNAAGNHTHTGVPQKGTIWYNRWNPNEGTHGNERDGGVGGRTDAAGNHAHSISGTANARGVSGVGKNNPAFFALAFIMKT